MNLTVKQQKPADKTWYNESGTSVPFEYVRPYERLNERLLASLAKEALGINKKLAEFKDRAFAEAKKMYDAFIEANDGKAPGKGKGGITLTNFDNTLKVEVQVQEQIQFDENFIGLAKDKLDELLQDGLNGASEFIKPLVMDAFKTSGGKLDTKRVLALRRYADRITDPRYAKAMSFIDQAIRKPESKQYMRVWVKDDKGEFVDVQLNFSAI